MFSVRRNPPGARSPAATRRARIGPDAGTVSAKAGPFAPNDDDVRAVCRIDNARAMPCQTGLSICVLSRPRAACRNPERAEARQLSFSVSATWRRAPAGSTEYRRRGLDLAVRQSKNQRRERP